MVNCERFILVGAITIIAGGSAHGGEIKVHKDTSQQIGGTYQSTPAAEAAPSANTKTMKSLVIPFDSVCTSQKCEVTIKLGKHTVVASKRRNNTEDFSFRAHNHVVTAAEATALDELEKLISAHPTAGPEYPAGDLLYRVAAMLSEAQVGQRLENMNFRKDDKQQPKADPLINMSVEEIDEAGEPVKAKDYPVDLDDEDVWTALLQEDAGDDAMIPKPMPPAPMAYIPPDPKNGDCVIDPFGGSRPRYLVLAAFQCCMSCNATDAGTTDLYCYPLRGKHFGWTSHDAEVGPTYDLYCKGVRMQSRKHCLQSYYFEYGTNAFDKYSCSYGTCPGRCGSGCNSIRETAIYTVDCMAHDYCVRAHPRTEVAWDPARQPNCRDEYWNAARDLTYGWRRYGGC